MTRSRRFRSYVAPTLVALVALGCSEAPTPTEVPASRSSAGVPALFDVVTVQPRVAAEAAGPVVSSLAQALERVRPGGTVRVLAGTHSSDRVLINKPVTIEGVGQPTLDAGGHEYNLAVDFATAGATAPGPVVIRGLRFVNGRWMNVWVSTSYQTVLLDDSEFHPDETGGAEPFQGRYYSAGVSVFAAGDGVTVRNSRFLQGAIGVIGSGIRVEGSYFEGQSNASLHGGDVDAIDNVVNGCDNHEWCFFLGEFFSPVDLEVRGNRIETGRPVHNAIVLLGGGGTAVVEGNTILGTDAAGDPLPPSQSLLGAALDLNSLASAQVNGNTVANLHRGVTFGGDVTASGRDNRIDNVVEGFWLSPGANVTFRFNDVTRYTSPAVVFVGGAFDLSCNWWGTADGPTNAGQIEFFRPWADTPIAGTGATSCEAA